MQIPPPATFFAIGKDLQTVVVFLLVFTALVFVHELGHFVTAKLTGMRVLEFGFGFPPRAFAIRHGGVVYSVNWIPFGGFVRILGEDAGAVQADGRLQPDSFGAKPIPARALVLLAGVLMNVLLAIAIYTVIFATGEPTFTGKVRWLTVEPGSPAAAAGMRDGDVIVRIDGRTFATPQEMTQYIYRRAGREIALAIERDGAAAGDLMAVPRPEDERPAPVRCKRTGAETQGPLGLCDAEPVQEYVPNPVPVAFVRALQRTAFVLTEIARGFGSMVQGVFAGRGAGEDVVGPVGIFDLTGRVVRQGANTVLQLLALLSLNLAIFNVVPFPGLDGGRLLFVLLEGLRGGRRLDPRTEAAIHAVGFVMLLFLVFVVSFLDIRRLAGG